MNSGTKFQNHIKESALLQLIDIEKVKDAGFQGVTTKSGQRFTSSNLCDYIAYDGTTICWLEAKSTGTSLSFGDTIEVRQSKRKYNRGKRQKDKQKINYGGMRQKEALFAKSERLKLQNHSGVMVGFLVEFKRLKKVSSVWWIDIDDALYLEEALDKKSFNEADCKSLTEMFLSSPIKLRTWIPERARKPRLDIKHMFMEFRS